MRKQWFGDARDYVKWSCITAEAGHEFAVVYGPMLRPDAFSGKNLDSRVVAFFDELKSFQRISTMFPAGFDYLSDIYEIGNADRYFDTLEDRILTAQEHSRVLVFLDPDTGVEPRRKAGNEHLRTTDITRICRKLRAGEKLVIYQHASRKENWQEIRFNDLLPLAAAAKTALGVPFHEQGTAKDVCFYKFTKTG